MKIFAILTAALLAAVPAVHAQDIVEVRSDGGLTAWLVEEPSIPIVAIEISVRGGASIDPDGQEGVARLTMGLLDEGAGALDATAFSQAEESLGVSLSFGSGRDHATISARMLSENREESLALLRTALMEPRFDEEAIERVRGQILSRIRSDAADPNSLAGQAYRTMAFPDHPYGRPTDGTLESVAALTREDVVAAHRALLVRDRLFIGVVGDISADEVGPMLDALLGDLPTGGPDLPAEVSPILDGGIEVVSFATPQSVALFGQPGIARDDADFYAAFVMNHILGGGGFSSRLTEEVREKRGLTYGVGSYLVNYEQSDVYLGTVASANGRIAEAVEVIAEEWRRMAEEGVSAEDLEKAKRFLTGAYPLRFDSNASIARILVGVQEAGLPITYPVERNSLIEAVTLEDVNRVAAELLQPDALTFVVVGQPEGLPATN
ncbi:MAG: pitrilysin family protein [Pseudomonadota bacterium]